MSFIDITIREFQKSDSLNELTELLHRSYKILADMNLKYVATYQDVSITRKRIDKGICFVAINNEKIIGTVTYYSPENSVGSSWLEKEGVAHFGQLGVEPDYRNKGIGGLLISHVENFAQKHG
ncbi:MAG: GNAT family N-acetyltransferase, partial [candidate division Zixibacteria bacterium]|nr:GNAT family N-acetyltransferase [candidate division Zixibacteria bacterium]